MRTRSVLIVMCFASFGCQHGGGASAAASASASTAAAPAATPGQRERGGRDPAGERERRSGADRAAVGLRGGRHQGRRPRAAHHHREGNPGRAAPRQGRGEGEEDLVPRHKTTIVDDGEFMIAFARTAPAKERLTLTLEDGSILERDFDVEQRTYETDKIDGLPKNQVELDAATKKKVVKAEQKFDELRMKFGDSTCYRETFKWPVKGKITSRYGQPRVLNGTDAGPHWGVDIVAAAGTPVHAPACGKVVAVERDVPLSGNVVIINHGRGLTSTFLHLDKFKVKVGDAVKQGDAVGTVGLTGRTNGAHLDWRMNLFDIRINPELVAPPM